MIRPSLLLLLLSFCRTLPVGAENLSKAARSAEDAIRRHQQPAGYWLTRHTSAARFEDPQPEMNTYLTSVMVDLLDPIAAPARLSESVARARRHLRAQIEETGLVRYHGLPGSAALRAGLGCVITPDSDDTVLAWRVAPSPDRTRLERAFEVLKRYRTPEGLYQIWLAPRQAYSCLDPGEDPNPADAGVQMHAYLLLAKEDPPAARELCESLQKTIALEKVWVYNTQAPLEVILRRRQMAAAGCPLDIPENHQRTPVAGQQIWLDVARRLDGEIKPGASDSTVPVSEELLKTLSREDFSALRKTPPLLYHNDLTAHVSRFYWSEDFGYALWLRLYSETRPARRALESRP